MDTPAGNAECRVPEGIPVVGAVGGAYDMVCMKRVNTYAAIKYQRRHLYDLRAKDAR